MNFQKLYEHSPAAFTFLSEYYKEDVGVIRFTNFSVKNWIMPPIAAQQMIQQLQDGRDEKEIESKHCEWTVPHGV